jgi:hypothetical protein
VGSILDCCLFFLHYLILFLSICFVTFEAQPPATQHTASIGQQIMTTEQQPPSTSASGRRASYRCSRCGEPKRGHQCIFEQRLLAAAAAVAANTAGPPSPTTAALVAAMARPVVATVDAAAQAEMDESMTVRALLLRGK